MISKAFVIGGGPAGLMAAEVLATSGLHVTVVDRMRTPGRKFILAGRGGLNLTHSESVDALIRRYSPSSEHLVTAIRAFPPMALRAWAAGLGESTFVGSSGRVFPESFGATPLLRSWLERLTRAGVVFERESRWLGITTDDTGSTKQHHRFLDTRSNEEWDVDADVTILALGGASWPRSGSDGQWVALLREHGITVEELLASNCGYRVHWSDHFRVLHAGQPLKNVSVTVGTTTRRGELLVTDTGFEGGLVYALGSDLRSMAAGSGALATDVAIDLRPDVSAEALTAELEKPRGSQSTSTWLSKRAHLTPTATALVREVSRTLPTDPGTLARLIKTIPVHLEGPQSIDRAISTAGGISFDEVSENFMLTKLPGVFVAGEMLNYDAPTGGYLLQASMSTGQQAGVGAVQFLSTSNPMPGAHQ